MGNCSTDCNWHIVRAGILFRKADIEKMGGSTKACFCGVFSQRLNCANFSRSPVSAIFEYMALCSSAPLKSGLLSAL